jgi:hypothetical protein
MVMTKVAMNPAKITFETFALSIQQTSTGELLLRLPMFLSDGICCVSKKKQSSSRVVSFKPLLSFHSSCSLMIVCA